MSTPSRPDGAQPPADQPNPPATPDEPAPSTSEPTAPPEPTPAEPTPAEPSPADVAADAPVEQPAEQPVEQPVEQPAEQPVEQPGDLAAASPDQPTAAAPAGSGGGLRSLLPVLALALVTVLLLLTGYLGWQAWQQSRTEAAREDALEAARTAGRVLFSYDHEQLDEDFEAGLAVATGTFREQYERTTRDVVRPVAEQYDTVVAADVVEAGVVSAQPERVVAVVYINQTTTSTRIEGPRIDQSRVRMSLRLVDGEWLVDEVRAL
ncbi:MAG TPA: hypothetical protein VM433_06500 [Mycobacteriales bacterium]|nr:hypothetical protein [Mycobacteriales bacterium]